ncbi:MAG: hypothetical protein JW715_09165, partial [Sedimentisphaerales bacterium]|nr:hypothetical protein [Sedimentisphaerales bacterium]
MASSIFDLIAHPNIIRKHKGPEAHRHKSTIFDSRYWILTLVFVVLCLEKLGLFWLRLALFSCPGEAYQAKPDSTYSLVIK